MTAPAWLASADDEDLADLASVGIILTTSEVGFPEALADRDAAMSQILRQIGRAELDLERYNAAKAREHMTIDVRYARITDAMVERVAWLTSLGHQLALETEMPGKSKTRHVAYGDYGARKVPERISIEDGKQLLAWAITDAPELIDEKVERRVLQKAVAEYFKSTGDLPPGCRVEPEHSAPVLKPDLEILRAT